MLTDSKFDKTFRWHLAISIADFQQKTERGDL